MKFDKTYRIFKSGEYLSCLSEDTEILTESGFKTFEEIKK